MNIKKLLYRNFAASGKSPIQINFDDDDKILVTGENGSGKSTVLDAICFSLYGKPYKEINKPTIVNSINKKNCLVEIWFEKDNKEFYIKRGITPNIFEIHVNGTLIPQNASAKEYQTKLEVEYLNMNFSTFKQIAIIGKSGFVPFMQLDAAKRRSIIEDILELSVFSHMSALLKLKVSDQKQTLSQNENEILKIKTELEGLEKQHLFLSRKKDEEVKKSKEKNAEIKAEISTLQDKIKRLNDKLVEIDEKLVIKPKIDKKNIQFRGEITSINNDIRSKKTEINFFEHTSSCPTCKQEMDIVFREQLVEQLTQGVGDREKQLDLLSEQSKKVEELIEKFNDFLDKKNKMLTLKSNFLTQISSFNKVLSEKLNLDDLEEEMMGYYNEMGEKEIVLNEKEKDRQQLLTDMNVFNYTQKLLKDDGIKAVIIKTFIPVINAFINKYLDLMNFYVQFEIDENFNEVIKSRYRDELSYANFSEGEKARIDLALLFAWRGVVKKKTNVEVGFMILDEVHGGSLDVDGEEDLLKILKSFDKTKIIVITHSDKLKDSVIFNKTLRFEKVNNFSTMKMLT